MKKDNYFEADSPTMEMENQNYRTMQPGQPIPVVGGIGINPYTGFAFNPSTSPYSQQPLYGNFNRFTVQPTPQPYMVNPASGPMNPSFVYGGTNVHPMMTGVGTPGYWGTGTPGNWGSSTPGYLGNGFPTPYMTTPTPYMTTPTPFMTNSTPEIWGTNPGTSTPGQWGTIPFTQPTNGNGRTYQPTSYFPPAINVADGQYMAITTQYPQGTKNGSTYSKSGERDFTSWIPNVNILETDSLFKIEICVPGVTKENCRINIDKNNILHVSGTRRWNQETDTVGFTRKEFNYGSFGCSFMLTDDLHKTRITSSCRSGLLIITIPKKEGSDGDEKSSSEISIS